MQTYSQEAQKAYEAAQYAMVQHATSAPVASVPANVTQEGTSTASGDGMDVDVPTTSAQGKRKASEEPEVDGTASKKVRMGMTLFYHSACISFDCYRLEPPSAPLKRYVCCPEGRNFDIDMSTHRHSKGSRELHCFRCRLTSWNQWGTAEGTFQRCAY